MNFKQTKRKQPVTLIIGSTFRDVVTLACDSRTTDPSGRIRDDAVKIHTLDVSGNDTNDVLIAQAGNADLGVRAVEISYRMLKGKNLDDYRAVADTVQLAVAELKRQIREQFQGTAIELQRHFDDYGFELMIAYTHNKKPYIFTLDFALGQAIWRRDQQWVCTGCGSEVAHFILSQIDTSVIGLMDMYVIMVYAIEEVKRVDGRCGGPAQLMSLMASGTEVNRSATAALLPKFIESLTGRVNKMSARRRSEWAEKTREMLGVIAEESKGQKDAPKA